MVDALLAIGCILATMIMSIFYLDKHFPRPCGKFKKEPKQKGDNGH